MFFKVLGDSLQHWARVVLPLMNSTFLSVRTIAVDFFVSLVGKAFELLGNIDELSLVFLTVVPEVVAREIALYTVSDQIRSIVDVENVLWPLRRAIADVEEDNADDDRIDLQLTPLLQVFCRTCQAIMDGVLIELRLMGDHCHICGLVLPLQAPHVFDADQESLFEAANFFYPKPPPCRDSDGS